MQNVGKSRNQHKYWIFSKNVNKQNFAKQRWGIGQRAACGMVRWPPAQPAGFTALKEAGWGTLALVYNSVGGPHRVIDIECASLCYEVGAGWSQRARLGGHLGMPTLRSPNPLAPISWPYNSIIIHDCYLFPSFFAYYPDVNGYSCYQIDYFCYLKTYLSCYFTLNEMGNESTEFKSLW